jgi:hypothetical protein
MKMLEVTCVDAECLRAGMNLTQQAMADLLGVDVFTVYRWGRKGNELKTIPGTSGDILAMLALGAGIELRVVPPVPEMAEVGITEEQIRKLALVRLRRLYDALKAAWEKIDAGANPNRLQLQDSHS